MGKRRWGEDDEWDRGYGDRWGGGDGRWGGGGDRGERGERWGGGSCSGKPRAGYGFASDAQKARNASASAEGRAVYVRGLPPDWSKDTLIKFFEHQGKVECANLMPPKPGQKALAAFVNFETPQDAANAAEVCDNLAVDSEEAGPASFRLVCSLKRAPGQRVDMVSGFSELSKARQEKRSVYISGLPMEYGPQKIKVMIAPYGIVEEVKELPSTRNKSCFVILGSHEEAAAVIEALDGKTVDGRSIAVNFPRPPKRTRGSEDDQAVVEIRGFPREALPTEVSSAIESGGREVLTVKILRHGSMKSAIALVYMKSSRDAYDVVAELNGFEMSPGYVLHARVQESDLALEDQAGAAQPPRLLPLESGLFDEVPHEPPPLAEAPPPGAILPAGMACRPWQPPPRQHPAGPRCKGAIVGTLQLDGPFYDAEDVDDGRGGGGGDRDAWTAAEGGAEDGAEGGSGSSWLARDGAEGGPRSPPGVPAPRPPRPPGGPPTAWRPPGDPGGPTAWRPPPPPGPPSALVRGDHFDSLSGVLPRPSAAPHLRSDGDSLSPPRPPQGGASARLPAVPKTGWQPGRGPPSAPGPEARGGFYSRLRGRARGDVQEDNHDHAGS